MAGTDARVVTDRLRSQWLVDRPGRTPADVVSHLLAVQAQDGRGARLAIRSRSTAVRASNVDAAFDRGELVISWLNRGTLHLVRSEDYWWLHPLTTPQLRTSNTRRLRMEGVSPEALPRALDVVVAAVADGPMTRHDLRQQLDAAGIRTAGQALVHILVAATLDGHVVRGPMVGTEQAFVSVERWLGRPPPAISREEALARLGRRYLAAHAPADPEDLANWAGITLSAARSAMAGAIQTSSPGGDKRPEPRLLGPFDPLLHGWKSREPFVGPHQSVVTTNGLFRPVALVGGRAVGTWGLRSGLITIHPLERIREEDMDRLVEDAVDVRRYLGLAPGPTKVAGPA